MDTDPLFPRMVFYLDGREVRVHTAEALAALPPGWRDSPKGPWPAWVLWDVGGGPFAPDRTWPQSGGLPHGPGLVYATRALIYHERAYAPGRLLLLQGNSEGQARLDAGDVVPILPSDAFARHAPTGQWFTDENARDIFARCYAQGDLAGLGVEPLPPQVTREPSPFDPCPLWDKVGAIWAGPQIVVATRELPYQWWKRSRGEVFKLEGHLEDTELLTSGAVKPLSDYAYGRIIRTKHQATKRFFMDQETLDRYTWRYDNRAIEDVVPAALPPPDTAPTPAPGDTPQPGLSDSRQPRDSRAHWKNWTNRQALREFQRAAQKARAAHLPITRAHLGKYLTTSRHRNTVREMLKHHGITLDDL